MADVDVDEPLAHVERPRPPWRSIRQTECGRVLEEFAVILTRDEFAAKVKKQGIQRASLTTCMTCVHAVRRWGTWEEDPVGVVARDTYNSRYGHTHDQAEAELRVLGMLYEAHRDEFDEALAGLTGVGSLAEARAKRRDRPRASRF